MGCDETAGWLVLNALTRLSGMGWVGSAAASSGSVLSEVKSKTHDAIDARVEAWRAASNKTAAGNLGEQVAMRTLEKLGYQVLATQRDLQGAVPSILDLPTRMNPEDFVVITPDGEYSSMNAKASMTEGTSKILASGDLKAPRMGKGQDSELYYSTRAGLLSPLEGQSFGKVIKVDLIHKQAQVFDIGDDRRLTPVGEPVDVLSDIAAVCLKWPEGNIPPPIGPNSAETYEDPS